MDFVQILSEARLSKWVRVPNTQFELNVKKLTTNEINRCRQQATKNGKIKLDKLTELIYKKAVLGIRGLTLEMLEDQFSIHLESVQKNGQAIGRQDVIESNPIEDFWLTFVSGMGAVIPEFYYWMMDHTGQNVIAQELEEEEDEKKTSPNTSSNTSATTNE